MDDADLVSQEGSGRRPQPEKLADRLPLEHSKNAEAAGQLPFEAICELQLIRSERADMR